MAGYTKNREQNYEIKYLRKVLVQVDDRIQVPESVSADSLRHLLDNVDAPVIREPARRPRLLSLQSGIAYAAAFALIVALFYSTRLYRPDIITGGMNITESNQPQQQAILLADGGDEAADAADALSAEQQAPFMAAGIPEAEAIQPFAEPIAVEETEPAADYAESADDIQPRVSGEGLGGGGKATLLTEQDQYSFYWRENDINDPDRSSPISFEVINTVTQEAVAQTDVPLAEVTQSFELDGNIVFVGSDLSGDAAIYNYNISDPVEPVVQGVFIQEGNLIDVKVHKDVVRIISLADSADNELEAELLPNCISDETCVITAFDPETQITVTKRFTGANGSVQLHNLNAYIRYTGEGENGESKEYIAQILFDGMDITLGTVS